MHRMALPRSTHGARQRQRHGQPPNQVGSTAQNFCARGPGCTSVRQPPTAAAQPAVIRVRGVLRRPWGPWALGVLPPMARVRQGWLPAHGSAHSGHGRLQAFLRGGAPGAHHWRQAASEHEAHGEVHPLAWQAASQARHASQACKPGMLHHMPVSALPRSQDGKSDSYLASQRWLITWLFKQRGDGTWAPFAQEEGAKFHFW